MNAAIVVEERPTTEPARDVLCRICRARAPWKGEVCELCRSMSSPRPASCGGPSRERCRECTEILLCEEDRSHAT